MGAEESRTPSTLIVRRARVEDADGLFDIAVTDGRITAVEQDLEQDAAVELDADGRLASPAFVEPHIHLDKYGSLPLLPPNAGGTLAESIELMLQIKREASAEDIRQRAGKLIRSMVIAGTTVIRSHVDVDAISGLRGVEGIDLARRDHADICDIEIVAFPQLGVERDHEAKDLMARAMHEGADVVGGMPHWEADHEAAGRHIEFCMQLAHEHDADVDMHVDETDDGRWHTLELLVEAADRHGYGGRTTAGHCCAMAAWDDAQAARLVRRAAEVGVSIITNPATNLVIQGREDRQPIRRGITRVKELMAGGVNVAAGQDNLFDGFYPLGAGDQMLIAWLLVHAAQLTTPEEMRAAMATVRSSAAKAIGLADYGIAPGGRGDLVVLDAETPEEALRLQAARRWVVRGGQVVAETRTEHELRRASTTA
jgi:cytosine deaminase